jgi:alkanesulfonate monooxygenase
MVASLAHLHGRRVDLNMLAGGFKNDLTVLGDATPHDERYARTVEYASVMQRLLAGDGPVEHEGRYYRLHGAPLSPSVPPRLAPGWMISGSSPAGLEAARALGAVAIKYPAPATDERPEVGVATGVRVGLVARPTREEAWAVARDRFPETRAGRVLHGLAMKASDSHWHRQLSETSAAAGEGDGVYWLGPFQHYQTFCPYLVGSYEEVAAQLRGYVGLGHRTFVLDIPPSRAELEHTGTVFDAVGAFGA